MKKISKTPIIPLSHFERIAQLIFGITKAEGADPATSCLCFGYMGAAILQHHYKLEAKAVIGNAAYVLPKVGLLAFQDTSIASSTPNNTGFHCWIEANGWLIDFSSITFPQLMPRLGLPDCPSLMLQKPLVEASLPLLKPYTKFGFYVLPNDFFLSEVTKTITTDYFTDLCNIVTEWYRKPPRTMLERVGIKDQQGNIKPATLRGKIQGVW